MWLRHKRTDQVLLQNINQWEHSRGLPESSPLDALRRTIEDVGRPIRDDAPGAGRRLMWAEALAAVGHDADIGATSRI